MGDRFENLLSFLKILTAIIWHAIVLLHMQTFMCYCTVFALLYLNLRRVFCAKSLGGLYLEGLILRILRYLS